MIWRNESASLGDRVVEITEVEQKKEKGVKRNEDRLRERDNVKCVDIHGIGAPQGEERGRAESTSGDTAVESFLTPKRKQTSRSRKHRAPQTGSAQGGMQQDML